MTRKSHIKQVGDVDIRLLRVFRTIVACGGLSAAELALNVGRSTVSRHLTDLEVRLGMKLCDRGPAGFALTKEGERVFEASTHLLTAIETFKTEANDVQQHLMGTLSIGLFDKTITNPAAHLSSAFRLFVDIAPGADLQVSMEASNEMENGILGGRLQVGIIPVHRKSSSLKYLPLYSEQMSLYCGKGNPLFDKSQRDIHSKDIRAARYAGLGYHSPNMMISNKRRFLRRADANDQEALAVLILSGRYIGFLPDHFSQPHVDSGNMKIINPGQYRYQSDFNAIVRRHPKPTRLAETFLECLRRTHPVG